MSNFQRVGSGSNTQVGRDFENLAFSFFSKSISDLRKNFPLSIGIYVQKNHNFDLGSSTQKVIIECKAHTWTSGGNIPSAKLTTWDQAMLYFFLAPRSFRKLFVVQKDLNPKTGESLCRYYLRTHPHVIPDEVEFWEVDEETSTFEQIEFDLTSD